MITDEKLSGSNASRFSWKARRRSFIYAWQGIRQFLKTEHNAQIHLAGSVLAIALSVTLEVSRYEVIAVVFCMALVWITEMINTAIEKAMDLISVKKDPRIKFIKDLAAGAVLVAAVAALLVGGIIFLPKMGLL